MSIIFWGVYLYFLFNLALKFISFWMYQSQRRAIQNIKSREDFSDCVIMIPFYEEEAVIEEALSFFSDCSRELKGLKIIWIGTDRETSQKSQKIVRTYIDENSLNTFILDSSGLEKKYMAGQINYSLKKYVMSSSDISKVAIYNIDSRPSIGSLKKNFSMLDNIEVVQQYGAYFNNIPRSNKTLRDLIYINTFLWQSAWAIQFEIRNIWWNKLFRKIPILKKFSYVVGHGFFFQKEVITKVGYLSEEIQNEDMELSLRLHKHNIKIEAGDDFSNSDMPLNLSDYLSQQAVWARGPMLAFNYLRESSFSERINALKLFLHYVYWLGEGAAWLLFLLASLFLGKLELILFLSTLTLYISIVFIMPNKTILKNTKISYFSFRFLLSAYTFLLLHSIGPFICLCRYLKESFTGKRSEKFKTPKGVSS